MLDARGEVREADIESIRQSVKDAQRWLLLGDFNQRNISTVESTLYREVLLGAAQLSSSSLDFSGEGFDEAGKSAWFHRGRSVPALLSKDTCQLLARNYTLLRKRGY